VGAHRGGLDILRGQFRGVLPPTNEDEPLELTDAEKLAILWAEYLKEHTA